MATDPHDRPTFAAFQRASETTAVVSPPLSLPSLTTLYLLAWRFVMTDFYRIYNFLR